MQKERTKTGTSEPKTQSDLADQTVDSSGKKKLRGIEKKTDSLLTLGLKTISALLPSVFFAGIISGLLEASTGLTYEFGSFEFILISVPQVILFFYLFFKLFSYLGLFEHPDNPDFKE